MGKSTYTTRSIARSTSHSSIYTGNKRMLVNSIKWGVYQLNYVTETPGILWSLSGWV